MRRIRYALADAILESCHVTERKPELPGFDECIVCHKAPLKEYLRFDRDESGAELPTMVLTCGCGRRVKGGYHIICERWNSGEIDYDGARPYCSNPSCTFPNPVSGGTGVFQGRRRTIYRCRTCDARWWSDE